MKEIVGGLVALLALGACMNNPPPQDPSSADESSEGNDKKAKNKDTEVASDDTSPLGSGANPSTPKTEHATIKDEADKKASPCGGSTIADLLATISQTACEVPKATPESLTPRDVKDALDVSVTTDAARVPPGARANLTVTLVNKGATDLPLDFVADPEPRFEVAAYTAKGVRADKPTGREPPLPASVTGDAPERAVARVTLAPKGSAKFVIPWDAVKYKWASPDKAKGAVVGQPYPRETAGPLPRGKYVVRVVMPLAGVSEGADHEISQPRTPIEIAGH